MTLDRLRDEQDPLHWYDYPWYWLKLLAWYLWPDQRFVVLPAIIVAVYVVTLVVLVRRPRRLPALAAFAAFA